MPYAAPDHTHLKRETEQLQQSFADLIKRYKAPSYKDLRDKFINLEDFYKKKLKEKERQSWVKCFPDKVRLEQIACITQLTGHMPPIEQPAPDEKKIEEAQSILIGAGLYRYFRIDNSYKMFFGFFGEAQDNSALNMALHEVLGLSDKNKMDPLTWAKCCTAYRDYLLNKGNYKSYNYIANDPNFFSNLEDMILREQAKGRCMLKQSQYIIFIQSVLKMLNSYPAEVMQLSIKLEKSILKNQKSKNNLSKTQILELLETIEPKRDLYNLYASILPEEYGLVVKDSQVVAVSSESESEFGNDIQEKITAYCYCALLAAYILVLKEINEIQKLGPPSSATSYYNEKTLIEALKQTLEFAIEVHDGNPVDAEMRNSVLTSMQVFADLDSCNQINTEAWGGMKLFKGELRRQLVEARQCHTKTRLEEVASFAI